MRRLRILLAVMSCMALAGCSGKDVETQAYAVSLGMDLTEEDQIEVSVQIPALNQSGSSESGGESEGGGGGKGYTFSSATGNTLTEALERLNAATPRELNLTGVKSIAVSEKLARSERFSGALNEMAMAYRVYGAAEMIVCRGEAGDFIQKQKAVIGLRMSESTTVALGHYLEIGNIPSAKAADIYYLSRSIYGDPVAILGAVKGEGDSAEKNGYAGEIEAEGDSENQYFGTALLSGSRMVGTLTGIQTQLLNVLLGDLKSFSWVVDGTPVRIVVSGSPKVRVEVNGSAPIIEVSLTVDMMDSEKRMKPERLEEIMRQRLEEMTQLCQELGVDPFRYAERAAGKFPTVEEWLQYDWKAHFPNAQVIYHVEAKMSEL